ncbi:MAG: hypothetical protein ACP5UV_06160, partial [Thermoplasmata archaeon]
MDARESYSVKFANELFSAEDSVLYTLKYIKDDEYHSNIYRITKKGQPEKITFGNHEKHPKYLNGNIYYIRYEKNKETLMEIRPMEEPREIVSFAEISDYLWINNELFVIAIEKSPDNSPFATARLKYRFNARGLIRDYYSLFRVSEKT